MGFNFERLTMRPIFIMIAFLVLALSYKSQALTPNSNEAHDSVFHNTQSLTVNDVGSPIDNGRALIEAVRFVNEQSPSEERLWLIILTAEVYDIGKATLSTADYVSIRGAGMRRSKLSSATNEMAFKLGRSSTISELWIDLTNPMSKEGIYLSGVDNVHIQNVNITTAGRASKAINIEGTNNVILDGVHIVASNLAVNLGGGRNRGFTIRNSRIMSTGNEAFSAGIIGDSSVIENSTLTSTGNGTSAVNSFGGSTEIHRSNLISTTGGAVRNASADALVKIHHSFISVNDSFTTHFTAGTSRCYGIRTPGSATLQNNTCQ